MIVPVMQTFQLANDIKNKNIENYKLQDYRNL